MQVVRPSEAATHPMRRHGPPRWATGYGYDAFGPFAILHVGEVAQRWRWIPPGHFQMGSPADEPGRFADREAQHPVTISEGFWIADTPVSQALWSEVMGDNPSRFMHPERPVEQVSWEDVARFIERLRQRARELTPRLPTEAEWEYACRAGSDEATYAGPIEIEGKRNAPVLDAIAWYAGNSGVDFDLHGGKFSGGWSQKQYDHQQAGARILKRKTPNAHGLYDMLGNVREWCLDWYAPFTHRAAVDPGGPGAGEQRVVRGGSWHSHARRIRAAYRSGRAPDFRGDRLGFRLVLGSAQVVIQGEDKDRRGASAPILEHALDDAPEPMPTTERSGQRLWAEVDGSLRDALESIDEDAFLGSDTYLRLSRAIDMLESLSALPRYARSMEPELAMSMAGTLLSTRTQEDPPAAEQLRWVVEHLLRFHASRGPDGLPARERAFNALFAEVDRDSPEMHRLAVGAACAELGWDLVITAVGRRTLWKAERLCTEALTPTPRRSAARAALLGVHAQLHIHRGDPAQALNLHEERLEICRALSAIREQAMIWTRLARIYARRGALEDVQTLFYRALAVFEEYGAEHDRAVVLGDIARIKAWRDPNGALKMHRARLETLRSLNAERQTAIALGDIARILARQGQLDEAFVLHAERLEVFERLGHERDASITQGEIARIRAAWGQHETALAMYRKCLATFERLEDVDNIAMARLGIGQIHARLGHLEDAKQELSTAFALYKHLGHAEGTAIAGESLVRVLTAPETRATTIQTAIHQYERLGRADKVDELTRLLDLSKRASPSDQ